MENNRGRVDGRRRAEARKSEIERRKNAFLLRKCAVLGGRKEYSTALVVYTSTEIKKPSCTHPNRGMFSIKSNDKHLQHALERLFKDSQLFPLEKLSILPKRAVWHLKLDIFVVSDQGGVFDLAVEGIYWAVKEAVFPECFISFAYSTFCTKQVTLSPLYKPSSLTLQFLSAQDGSVLHDPLESERGTDPGELNIVVSDKKEIVNLLFIGSVDMDALLEQISLSTSALSSSAAAASEDIAARS